jgi:flagellar motility protein MotE (MotC chaperone)
MTGLVVPALLVPAAAHADPTTVEPGSVAYQNIETAIKFLRDHGENAAADEIEEDLNDGDISVDPDISANGETDALGNISIDDSVIGHTGPRDRNRPLDPEKDFDRVVALARTLYHENIHAHHQNYLYKVGSYYFSGTGGDWTESDAWRKTLNALDHWIMVEREKFDYAYRPETVMMSRADELREVRKIEAKIRILISYYGDYTGENNYFGEKATWGEWAAFNSGYWERQLKEYVQPRIETLTGGQPQVATGGTSQPAEPPAPPSKPEPPPPPTPVAQAVTCEPCRPIAEEIAKLREQIRQQHDDLRRANNELAAADQRVQDLERRAAGLDRELQRSQGTGGSSYDPTTGITVDAWDQGNGTVKVTTRDASGRITEEHIRDSSQRKADLRQRLEETRAEIAKAQANAKTLREKVAAAEQAIDAAMKRLEERIAALADCIRRYCSGLSVAEALNRLGLPFPSLNMLANPLAFNAVGGGRNTRVQIMIMIWGAGGRPGIVVPPATTERVGRAGDTVPEMPRWSPARGALAALLSFVTRGQLAFASRGAALQPARAAQPAGGRPPNAEPPVEVFLTSLGVSSGQAFDVDIVNRTGSGLRLAADALVVEPVDSRAAGELQRRVQTTKVAQAQPLAARMDGYCLEFAREAPPAGTLFRVASQDLQRRFAPLRKVLQASRQLQQAGKLNPDSDPAEYSTFVTQWSMWAQLEGWNRDQFTRSFIERTRKNLETLKEPWTREIDATVRALIPNRWGDIQAVLQAARQP